MKILTLGLDNSILDKNSSLAKRVLEYADLVESYIVIVPNSEYKKIDISSKAKIYGSSGGGKINKLIKIYSLAKKIIKEGKIDVISVQDQYYLAFIGYLLSKKFKIGLEIQIHGFEKFSGLRKMIAKFVLPRANSVRVVSQRLKKELIRDFRVEENKITVVPIYTPPVIALPSSVIPAEAGIQSLDQPFIFLTASRLVSVKNIQMQIKALADLENKKTELRIAGNGPEEKNLKKLVKDLKIENRVKFLGWIENMEEEYLKADVFLLTSNKEGWGMVAIEAMKYELPVIMTDVGCAGEVVKNQESGIVTKVGDEEGLKNAMDEMIKDEDLRKKLSQGAIKAIKNLPSKDDTLKMYKESWKKARIN